MDVRRRQNGESGTDKFLDLIADPFQGEVSNIGYTVIRPSAYDTTLRRTVMSSILTHIADPTELDLCRDCIFIRYIRPAGRCILLPPTT